MKSKTEKLLAVMNVLCWITFIGLMVKAGAILISYAISIGHPDATKNVYMGLDLYGLRQFGFWHYTTTVAFLVIIPALEAVAAYLVIKVLSRIKLVNPFQMEISSLLEQISYMIFGIWVVAMLYNVYTSWLMKKVEGLHENLISGEFIFMAGVVFITSQIFRKGVEIQSENELTV